MPEAVDGISITMPTGQPTYSTNLDAFHDTIRELEALHMMLASALIDGGLGKSSEGVPGLLRRQTVDLWAIHEAVKHDLDRLEQAQPSPYSTRQGREGLTGTLLLARVIQIVWEVWQDAGLDQGKADDAAWEETRRSQIMNLAHTYKDMIVDRLQDKADQIEAGSYLPWVEMKARKELEPDPAANPRNRPMLMRDQFIAESIRQGNAVGDIAQALGLSTVAVDRAIRRLSAKANTGSGRATA